MFKVTNGFSSELESVWYQTHERFLIVARDETLEELFAVIKVDEQTGALEEHFGNEEVRAFLVEYLTRIHDDLPFEECVTIELETMKREYEEGSSGTLPVHEVFGQTTFYCDHFELS